MTERKPKIDMSKWDDDTLHDCITEKMNICGCGDDGVVHFITDALLHPSLRSVECLVSRHPHLAAEAILQWMDHFGWTEHGGSVHGGWPDTSKRGKRRLVLFDALSDELFRRAREGAE